jgi:hypothetical protein
MFTRPLATKRVTIEIITGRRMAITRATITKLTDLAGFKVNTGVGLSGRRRKAPSEVFNGFRQS